MWRQGVGRWWGVHRRSRVPCEAMDVGRTYAVFCRIRRVLRWYLRGFGVGRRRVWQDWRLEDGAFLRQGQRAGLSHGPMVRLVECQTATDQPLHGYTGVHLGGPVNPRCRVGKQKEAARRPPDNIRAPAGARTGKAASVAPT